MILVVDDSVDILEAIEVSLAEAGYRVAFASDGVEALHVLEAEAQAGEAVEAILLDLLMPRMSGFELIEALGRDPRFAAIPVIVMTASGDGRGDTAHLRLEKPFSLDELLAIIRLAASPRAPGAPVSTS